VTFEAAPWSPVIHLRRRVKWPSERRECPLDAAAAERHDLIFPVRLLLLEREAEAPWMDQLKGAGGDRHTVDAAQFKAPSVLGPLDEDGLWCIISFLMSGSGHVVPDRDATLHNLREIDSSGRPLFAAFLADAISDGRDLRDWDKSALIRDVLEREDRKFWQPSDVTEKDKNLLALATMVGGLEVRSIISIDASGFLPDGADYSAERYAVLSGRDAQHNLAPLEPDILGELFVLEWLKPEHDRDENRAKIISQVAWKHSLLGMFNFLSRAVIDFASHRTLHYLQKPFTETPRARAVWSMAAFNMTSNYGDARELRAARGLYDQIVALARAHPDESALRESQARSAINLANDYGDAGDMEAMRGLYDAVAALAQAHTDERALRES
jgi:hypothetical protein